MNLKEFGELFSKYINFKKNEFHPMVWISGEPEIGKNVYISGFSEINAKGARVSIGNNCDIAAFVSISCADSHKRCLGLSEEIERKDIIIEENVFIGVHCFIGGGSYIGHHSVIAAGIIVKNLKIPPYSLVVGNPITIKEGYYQNKLRKKMDNKTIPHNKPTLGKEEEIAAIRVIQSGWLTQGIEVENFENEFCDFLGLPHGHAVAVSSGTSALFLALLAFDAKNKNIAFPSYVCSSLRHAVAMVCANEIIVDIKENTPNIDIDNLKNNNYDMAIIPHMYGIPVDVLKISNELIIEDCAQALGARINDINIGLQGKIGIFSFYATKLITSGGQGGMVVSKDKSLIDQIRDYREFDCRKDSKKRFNFQMTDLQAAIGREQLKKFPYFIKRREEIFQIYKQNGLNLLDINDKNIIPVRYRAVLMTPNPEKTIDNLENVGVKSIIPIEDWELLKPTPNALKLAHETVSLPIYPELTNDDIDRVLSGVKK